MILQQKKQTFWDALEDYFGLRYDPNNPKYRDAPKPDTPPPTKKTTPTPTPTQFVGENVKYNVQTGKWLREIVGESTDTNADKTTNTKRRVADQLPTSPTTFSWDVLTTPTNTAALNVARQEKLTELDLKLIAERGLDIAKGQTIKAFWFKKIPRNLAAATLSKQAKGYSEAIINPYYTVFNAALKFAESPTLKEK
jgi:hypothetical protein